MIDRKSFETLAQVDGQNCISFFIPTHRAGGEAEDRIQYKNTLSEVKNQLVNNGLSSQPISELLNEAKRKIDDVTFWQDQSDGLAVFIFNGKTTFHRLPIHFTPFLFVGNHLYLKPVLPVLTGNAPFYLLAISENATRLFAGEKYSITELETESYLPKSMEELMKYIDTEQQLQHHSGNTHSDSAIFHGHGGGKDMEEVRLREYLRLINKGVREILCDDETAPLILATVEKTAAIYREENDYPKLHPEFIAGNPEHDNPALLHEKAWELMRPSVAADLQEEQEALYAALAYNEASFSLHDIVPAAIAGRVKTLFVAKDDETWGSYQAAEHRIQIHEKRQENSIPLINEAAVRSFLNGGTVYVLPRINLPRPTGSVNAVYRYANVAAG